MAADDTDPAAERTLTALRREIDALDTSLLELLMKRAVLSDRVAHAKGRRGGGPVFRPGREMSILRRLAERVRSPLPVETVVAVWRQIISSSARLQGPFAVVAYAPDDESRYIDLAREHFGFRATVQRALTTASALTALEKGRAQVAVLPSPGDGSVADNGWWRSLGSRRPGGDLQVLARLPVLEGAAADGEAAIVGRQAFDASEDDRGYLVVETEHTVSRARLRTALEAARLEATGFPASAEEKVARGRAVQYQLVETAEWVPGDDARLRRLAATLGAGAAVRSLGGYAQPLAPSTAKRK